MPILNFWHPKQIANDIWRGSDPERPPEKWVASQDEPVPVLYLAWWAAYIVMSSLYSASWRRSFAADDVSELQVVNGVVAAADFMSALAGILAIFVVWRTTARQTARAAALAVRPEENPRPMWRRRSIWAAAAGVLVALALQGLIGVAAWNVRLETNAESGPTPEAPAGTDESTLFADDFSREGVWTTGDQGGWTFDYVDGQYRFLLRGRNAFWSSLLTLPRRVDSLALEVDATLHAGRTSTDYYGLACVRASQGAYLFGISPDGYYAIAFDPGEGDELELERLVEEFAERRFGPDDAPNRLRAECSAEDGEARLGST